MDKNLIEVGQGQVHYNSNRTRVLRYSVEMYHKGLKEHKLISAPDHDMLNNKATLQAQKWEEKWQQIEAKRMLNLARETNLDAANLRTTEAANALRTIDALLIHTLSIDDRVDWDTLKKKEKYTANPPSKPSMAKKKGYPPKPDKNLPEFSANLNFLDMFLKSRKAAKLQYAELKYSEAILAWEKEKSKVDGINGQLELDYENELKRWESEVAGFEMRKAKFLENQSIFNAKIDEMRDAYLNKNSDSIVEYCEIVLNNSSYPDTFPKNFEIEYNPENNIVIVEYELPPIDAFPKVKEVRYIASRNELKETYLPESQINKIFDDAMYKITLRTLHELFEADVVDAIQAISFNGWITSINPATGKEEHNCILSIQAKKDEFMAIDLSNVDPKACFKNLKGVASSKLSSLTPVQPILQISKTDKRFVDSYSVTDQIDTTYNLAAMDWEDFEHLIRELFEKEFQSNGGEVKVTQASRDGGVDAVAFDPDPIRGGKIVIQAKRYTNTVGVSAVRDLYGTVMNEGATKGILVSTSDYGADAYEFAKGKPLTLLNGSNLLYLLEKHGHHAKIDLKEAKRILAERETN